jgi:hypothetical protein
MSFLAIGNAALNAIKKEKYEKLKEVKVLIIDSLNNEAIAGIFDETIKGKLLSEIENNNNLEELERLEECFANLVDNLWVLKFVRNSNDRLNAEKIVKEKSTEIKKLLNITEGGDKE